MISALRASFTPTQTEEGFFMLSLYAVDKSFGRSKILKSIDLQLAKKKYGLLGPNGAGKTTLMRCIPGLYPLSAGKIEFNGSDISKDKNFQSHIGYLPQKFCLYKELTACEMMEMLADLKGISREKIGDEAKKYIKLVGLQDKLDKKVKTLSGGMIRRLGVAQALLGEPDIIIDVYKRQGFLLYAHVRKIRRQRPLLPENARQFLLQAAQGRLHLPRDKRIRRR